MNKTSRDILCLTLAGALTLVTTVSWLRPRRPVAIDNGDPTERATIIEPDSPEIIEQRRLEEERKRETVRLAEERREFIRIWGERIDAFNEGWPLAGCGEVFAEAAFDHGIDPRFAPAIARLESGSGTDCFLPYNAWGWHGASWTNWSDVIRDYTKLLAEGYGYTLSYAGATAYNGGNSDYWYNQVAANMAQIWPTDSTW